ncbi:MAG TPA: ABC transporter permease [Gemmatimonadaceae bacterium]
MRRVFRIPFRANIAREVDDELAFHLEMRTQRLIDAGMSPDAARREALRQFGDMETVRLDCVAMDQQRERAMKRAFTFAELHQDIGYALRTLRHNVGFTTIVVLALALGIGANTAIFTLINAVMVRSLPVHDPSSLVAVGNPTRVSSLSMGSPATDLLSYPLYKDVKANNRVFSDVLASGRTGRLDVRFSGATGELEHPRGRFVSGNYFSLLGIRPALGRVFDAEMDRVINSAPVAVISHGYWTRRFENDRSVIGREIVIQDVRFTIIGITPPSFGGDIIGAPPDIWLPVTMQHALRPNLRLLDNRTSNWLLLLGRLKPGVTLDQAKLDVVALMKRQIAANTPADARADFDDNDFYVTDGSKGFSRVRQTFRAPLLTLMAGVALLLCIICANVANLLLARSVARGREMAVRLALGADRSRLIRQLLTESIVLAVLGGVAGIIVAFWGSRALLMLGSDGTGAPMDLAMDHWVLAFTLGTSCFAVLLFGLVPALRASRVDLASTMRAGASSVTGSALGLRGQRAPLGKVLIACQVAVSVVLLVGAGMLVRSLSNLQSVDMGLDRDHLLVVELDANARGYSGARLATVVHSLRDRIAAIPGVSHVSYSENGIFSGIESSTSVQVPGFTARTADDSSTRYDQVGPNYAGSIGAKLIQGRDIDATDEERPVRTAVVNQALARFYFPRENAVGKFLRFDSTNVEIVGVIGDARDHELDRAAERRVYVSYIHTTGDGYAFDQPGALHLLVRTSGDPAALVQRVRAAVVAVDPSLPIDSVDPLTVLMRASIRAQRLVANLATSFGLLALLLAAIGLYGVMTYAITRRTGEIGLRVALGAQRGDVLGMVLTDALRLVGIGAVVGIPLAIASTRLLRSQLHGVETIDPVSIIAAIAVLLGSALAAVLIPALRASRVSPIVALRSE